MAVQDYKINYKSDFVLTINGDAGWATQFCIKFWTGMPSQAYFVGFDGVKYVNCRVGDTPTQLLVMFDDHHLPIGKLMMQIAYHTTIEEFPGSVFDEVTNARDVIVTIDGTDYQVMLDFTGEDAPELEFDLPAYANEAERIQNELQRQQNEADRIAAELQREQATAAAVQGAENVNAQLSGNILTVTNRNGVSTSVNTKGEQGEQGPIGPQGEQGEQGPQGIQGETGATGPQGLQGPKGPKGDTGISITDFVETGETETDTLYDIVFSDDTTKEVAIPKGEKGDQGEQGPVGPQGPMGDVAVITPEQQAAFTMYSEPGQNTNGPMTQKAVTDALYEVSLSIADKAVNNVLDLSAQSILSYWVAADGTPNTSGGSHFVAELDGYEYIRITASSKDAYYTWATVVQGTGWTPLSSNRYQVPANTKKDIPIPSGAKYLIVGVTTRTDDYTPSAVSLMGSVKPLEDMVEFMAEQLDVDSLCLGIGYPNQVNQLWTIDNVGTNIRMHWVLPITPEMKKIRIDAYSTHRSAYALVSAYSVPTNTTPCNFCNGFPSVYVIGQNGTTGWMDIPSDCKYIILIKNSGNGDFSPKTVKIIKDAQSDYGYLDEVKPSAFMQGAIKSSDGSDNADGVTTRIRSEYLPVKKGDVIHLDYNNQRIRVIPYDINKVLLAGAYVNWYFEKSYTCEADGYVRFGLAECDETNISPSTMRSVIKMRVNNDIVQLNANLIDSIANLKRPPRVGYTTQGEILSLLHFSDIHIDRPFELRRIIQFGELYSGYIDNILSTGDIQNRGWESGISDFTNTDGAQYILQAIGNHDAYVSNRWTFTSAVNVYNRFIAPFVSNWGVVQPSGAAANGYNYWYKDYTSQKVRLIALDCIYWDATQKTWLEGVLANTPSEYSVVCASHYRPRMNDILCNMDDLIYQPSSMNEHTSDEAVNAVQAYINNGGNFICWLCGHEHMDYIGLTSVTNTSQMIVGVACASQNEARTRYGVIARIEGEKSQDLFNIIGFDTYNKFIRILRVGADSDTFMRSKKTFCINYETHDIIAQF